MSAKKSTAAGEVLRNRSIEILGAVLAMAAIAFIVTVFKIYQNSTYDARYLELAAELRVHAQDVATGARGAIDGDEQAFALLSSARGRVDKVLQSLNNGTPDLPAPRPLLDEQLSPLSTLWADVERAVTVIVDNQLRLVSLHKVAERLHESMPQLQEEFDEVVGALVDNGAPRDQVAKAQRQSLLAERLSRNVDRMLQGGQEDDSAAKQLDIDAEEFSQVLNGMLQGNAARSISQVKDPTAKAGLERIAQAAHFREVRNTVGEISSSAPQLLEAHRAAESIQARTPDIQEATTALADRIGSLDQERILNSYVAVTLGVVVLIVLLVIGQQVMANSRRLLAVTAETNVRNQAAIGRLLDELAGLADGDLTIMATVGEDFTGTIADSINYTVEQMCVLVSSINSTSMGVSGAAEDSRSTALELADAAEHQAQEIAGASAAVNEMAMTIDHVSSNAAESAAVAERSVSLAKTGSEVVQNTIRGMDTIREQIQETSKRIKRLGESSQEIGDIVSLINDIADQTNILALNAAIQASMAGDAGRGFAVVADEVQRLAERSGGATKQIEALVKTIQSDTNEAVTSMELTTTEVVRGARLAEDAGVALEEIETVSLSLDELIQNISNAARQQASSAGQISNTMNIIQEITTQTSSGTTVTAQAIGKLADMTNELRNSVAGFKLPESHGV